MDALQQIREALTAASLELSDQRKRCKCYGAMSGACHNCQRIMKARDQASEALTALSALEAASHPPSLMEAAVALAEAVNARSQAERVLLSNLPGEEEPLARLTRAQNAEHAALLAYREARSGVAVKP